jgi:hypothetical protein
VGVVGVFLGASTTNKKKIIRVLGLRTAPVGARDVHGIYTPWDSAPVSVDGVWLGGWYVACGGGGSKTPVMGPTKSVLAIAETSRYRCPFSSSNTSR